MSETICQVDFTQKIIVEEFNTINHIIFKYANISSVKNQILSCLNNTIKVFNGFGWIYKSKLDKTGIENYILNDKIPDKKGNLLVNRYPHLIAEWDFEQNTGIDINTVTFGCGKKVWWKCLRHPPYFTHVYIKTSRNGKCKECIHDSLRKHDKDEKEEHIKQHIEKRKNNQVVNTTCAIGDNTEVYIENLLRNSNEFLIIDRVGQSGDNTDIIVTLKSGERKSIQVKTLGLDNSDSYYMNNSCKYPDDMLIVMVNRERTRFALEFAKNITNTKLTLTFNYPDAINRDIMYTDEKEFLEKIVELIPKSENYSGFISSESIMKEYNCALRLEDWCKIHGRKYRRNITNGTNGTTIDLFIDDIPIQAKYRSINKGKASTYEIHITKCAGTLNGKKIPMNYEVSDPFEYLVVEAGGTEEEPTKYHGQFCFIPKSELIKRKVLRSSTNKGQNSIMICPPDYHNNKHWSKKFWIDPFIEQ